MFLYYVTWAFKIWMVVDAAQRRADYYWFFIIFLVPFGEVVYFVVVKLPEYRNRNFPLGTPSFLKKRPSLSQARHQAKETPSIEKRLALADALFFHKQYDEALPLYDELVTHDWGNKRALYSLALTQLALGKFSDAVEILERLIEIDKSYMDYAAYRAFIDALWKCERQQEALSHARALAKGGTRIDHRVLLGEYLYKTSALEEAEAILVDVLSDFKHSPRYVKRMGYKAYRQAKRMLKKPPRPSVD